MNSPLFDGSRSLALAEQVCDSGFTALEQRDLGQLQRLLLDHLGCCYRGACLPWGERLQHWAEPYAGSGRAGLFATGLQASPAIASFVNATAAHGLELDDTHDESVSHPGAGIIATALALGRHLGSSGQAVLTAITAGYEVTGRVGAATNAAAVIEQGFHPTSLFAGFGVTATAGRLLQLGPMQMAHAWGLMLSMAGGSMQFSQEAEGTTVKRLHGGYAALHGVLAAEHASLGIAGPAQALDGRYGLLANFGRQQAPERLLQEHADGPEIHRISFKPYPCCRLFHSTLDALSEVTGAFSLDPGRIESMRVGGPEIVVSQHMLRRPSSEMAAQYSLPFTLGAALVHGPRTVDGFMGDALVDPRILALADRVEAEVDETMEASFPAHFGSWLELRLIDGSSRRAEVLDSLGTPARPMAQAELIDKFNQLVGATGTGISGDDVTGRLATFHLLERVDDFLEPFLRARSAAAGAHNGV